MSDEALETIDNIANILDSRGLRYDEISYHVDPITDKFEIHIHLLPREETDENSS